MVVDTMADLGVSQLILLGDEVAISAAVEAELEDRFGDGRVDRIAGATRYHTATGVAEQAVPAPDTVVLATGENVPRCSVRHRAGRRRVLRPRPRRVAPDLRGLPVLEEWTAVKTRWSLAVDQAEKDVLAARRQRRRRGLRELI